MKQNDMALELKALSTAERNATKRINDLEYLASLLRHNMKVAQKDFDSVNFERAAEVVESALRTIDNAADQLQRLRSFLNGLEDRAETYLSCKYGG